MNVEEEVIKMKGETLTNIDKEEIEMRAKYAKQWLELYAPEEFKFELQEKLPDIAKNFSAKQKSALKEVLSYVKKGEKLDGQELHTKLHEIRKSSDLGPHEFFGALYLAFLGKERGPKAGWFLSVLDRDLLVSRLEEVTA
jgi:lysyl-tRNA synthetase class 1